MDAAGQVVQGDCREVLASLSSESIAACITDPPYNYEFIGHKWDAAETSRRISRVQNGSTMVRNIPYGSGLAGGVRNARWYRRVQQNAVDYQDWCAEWGAAVFRVCKPGAVLAAFSSTRSLGHIQVAMERAGFYARDCIVYRRPSGIPRGLNAAAKLRALGHDDAERWDGWHSCLRNEWEAIVVLQKPLVNNYVETLMTHGVGLFHAQENGSFQSNILEGIARDRGEDFNVHCTVKPLALMEKLVHLFVPKGPENIVLDPFAGSGTTLVAARNAGCGYFGIDIVPDYVEIMRRRLAHEDPAVTPRREESRTLELPL